MIVSKAFNYVNYKVDGKVSNGGVDSGHLFRRTHHMTSWVIPGRISLLLVFQGYLQNISANRLRRLSDDGTRTDGTLFRRIPLRRTKRSRYRGRKWTQTLRSPRQPEA